MPSTGIKLLGISGSLRKNAYSTLILETIQELIGLTAELKLADLRPIPPYDQDFDGSAAPDVVKAFKKDITEADGIIISSTEYNHGIPGVLKNALDWASRPAFNCPFTGKPVLVMTSSIAYTGGVRAQYQIRETLVSMLARPIATQEIVIANVDKKIIDGKLADEAVIEFILASIEKLYRSIDATHPR
jgi:chromate reductase